MYTLIITFYLALIGIITMILLKRREVLSGKESLVSRLGERSDRFFTLVSTNVRLALSYINKRNAIMLTQWVAFHVLFWVRKVYVEIKDRALSNPHSRKVIDAVRGRGEVTEHGVSFYLRRISDK